MVTKFDKAIAAGVLGGGSAFAAFTSTCSSVFAIFGTHSAEAQAASAAAIGLVCGIVTFFVPNK